MISNITSAASVVYLLEKLVLPELSRHKRFQLFSVSCQVLT